MSKCRPDCCPSSSGDGSGVAIIGFIVLAAAAYEVIRAVVHAVEAIMRVVIEIVEITTITAGSIAVVTLLALIVVRLSRHRRQYRPAGVKVLAVKPTGSSADEGHSAIPAIDPAQLFAEAVANPDMDPRFVESILRNAMNGLDQ